MQFCLQAKFRETFGPAVCSQLSSEDRASAHYGLATSLQYSADCWLSGSKSCSNEEICKAEEASNIAAKKLLQEAVAAYREARH